MVGDDDHLVAVPDLGGLAELALENADGARAANVMGHQDVRLTQTLSPACTRALPAARASIFSVNVITLIGIGPGPGNRIRPLAGSVPPNSNLPDLTHDFNSEQGPPSAINPTWNCCRGAPQGRA